VIHVMTHDSIGLGEDGPTHQPVEHLASLRMIPNLHVLRPADAVETVEAWEVALEAPNTPSILCLTRQAVPALPRPEGMKAGVARGAYVLHEPDGGRDVTVIGTGSEVALALTASRLLADQNIRAAVVSAPCFSLFARQPRDYQRAVLGLAPRIGIEAAIDGDWARWLGPDGTFIGMTGFGASAPAERLYAEFGITSEAVVRAARDLVGTTALRG
jgi:transketolase